nr:hypothetical protein [uncultured Mediterranean phage uvMED]
MPITIQYQEIKADLADINELAASGEINFGENDDIILDPERWQKAVLDFKINGMAGGTITIDEKKTGH